MSNDKEDISEIFSQTLNSTKNNQKTNEKSNISQKNINKTNITTDSAGLNNNLTSNIIAQNSTNKPNTDTGNLYKKRERPVQKAAAPISKTSNEAKKQVQSKIFILIDFWKLIYFSK
jgi:hypothetical protein